MPSRPLRPPATRRDRAWTPRLVGVAPELDGAAATIVALLARLTAAGYACRIAAEDGPLRHELPAHGIGWEPVAWSGPRHGALRHLDALLAPGEPVLLAVEADTAHVVASVAANGPLLCLLPPSLAPLEETLGAERTARLLATIDALRQSGRARVLDLDDEPDADAAVEAIAAALRDLGDRPPRPELLASAELGAALDDDRRAAQRDADEIWQTRERLQTELDALR